MPEASIVLKAYDQITGPMKNIAGGSKELNKQFEEQQQKLQQLGERYKSFNSASAGMSAKALETKKSMDEAAKSFRKTGDEADNLKFEKLKEEYKSLTDAAKAYDEAAADTRKAMRDTQQEIRKLADASANLGQGGGIGQGGGDKEGDTLSALGRAGALKMAGDVASQWAKSLVSSGFGSEAGTLFSGALSGAASGAAIGSVVPGVGTAVGALVGGGLGALQSGSQIFEERDDAFKSYVQDAVEGQYSTQGQSLSAGSALAATRENDFRALSTLLNGDAEATEAFQQSLIELGRTPPFSYDMVTALSRDMLGLGLSTDGVTDRINNLSEASAALNLSESNVSSIVSYLESAQLAGKLDTRIVKSLSKMGINAYEALAEEFGISQEEVMENLASLDADRGVQAIYDYMGEHFAGAAAGLTDNFSGLTGIVASYQEDMDAAMGEGFNENRKPGLEAQRDWMAGSSGEAIQEANRAIGAWQANLENEKERYQREAIDAMMETEDYKTAQATGNAVEMGRMIMEAKIQGMNEYNASDGAQLALEAEMSLAEAVRDDTRTNDAYWDAGYRKSLWFSKGLAEGIFKNNPLMNGAVFNDVTGEFEYPDAGSEGSSNAYGLGYVPYDGYPAILHQGEQVLTAAEAREQRTGSSGVQVSISGNEFHVRSEGDIDAIAARLADEIESRALAYGG